MGLCALSASRSREEEGPRSGISFFFFFISCFGEDVDSFRLVAFSLCDERVRVLDLGVRGAFGKVFRRDRKIDLMC